MENTSQETVAQEALRLLDTVPANKFIAGDFTDKRGKCCAIGHYMRLKSADPSDYSEENCSDISWQTLEGSSDLRKSSKMFFRSVKKDYTNIASVNNNQFEHNDYVQEGIKDRVISVITDMVKAGY